ncbi:fungal hydrophobin [Panus rudis PR-1116 ss-1]|nr:fungal hydrophobin [Panus rudis PR-1116 ss-1]
MFRFAVVTLALALSAVASPTSEFAKRGACNTGPVQCCNSVQPAGAPSSVGAGGLLDIPVALQNLNIPIGLQCNPISVIALASGGNCNGQTACCDHVTDGLVGLNCVPLNVQA